VRASVVVAAEKIPELAGTKRNSGVVLFAKEIPEEKSKKSKKRQTSRDSKYAPDGS
jgi:hypothetical protein